MLKRHPSRVVARVDGKSVLHSHKKGQFSSVVSCLKQVAFEKDQKRTKKISKYLVILAKTKIMID